MKVSLLLVVLSIVSLQAISQEATNYSPPHGLIAPPPSFQLSTEQMLKMSRAKTFYKNNATARTTTTYTDWYDMWDQNFSDSDWYDLYHTGTGSTSGFYEFAVYSDSNLIYNYGPGPFKNFSVHGMGMSFDPTDSNYWSTASDPYLIYPIAHPIYYGANYTIDSFHTNVLYKRNNPDTTIIDSLVIEFAVTQRTALTITNDSGAYSLQYPTADPIFFSMTWDERPRFGTMRYNSGCGMKPPPFNAEPYINDCYFDSVLVRKQRYVFPLTYRTISDTDAHGCLDLYKLQMGTTGSATHMAIGPFTINSAREHLVSYTSFKSGVAYSLGTLASASNWIILFAGEPCGYSCWWRQSSHNGSYPGSFQDGLVATSQIRYSDTGFAIPYNVHDALIPSYAFVGPEFTVPSDAYHISWIPLAEQIVNVSNTIVNAFPNPADDKLNVSFILSESATISISLTNMIGQVVCQKDFGNTASGTASFDTKNLAEGVYFYKVIADGVPTSGNISIVH